MAIESTPVRLPSGLPLLVTERLAGMSTGRQEVFVAEYRRRQKSTVGAYLCWVLIGLHYLYLKRWGAQIAFWLTAGGLVVWWFVDLFRMPFLVRAYNQDVAVAVLRDQAIIGGA
jgi:TM2 domain-containing membrane protein YozV